MAGGLARPSSPDEEECVCMLRACVQASKQASQWGAGGLGHVSAAHSTPTPIAHERRGWGETFPLIRQNEESGVVPFFDTCIIALP